MLTILEKFFRKKEINEFIIYFLRRQYNHVFFIEINEFIINFLEDNIIMFLL